MKKCLITKKTENLNTSVTVNTEIGKITVWISDDSMDVTITDIKKQVDELLASAKEIADTFNFDLSQAINKGGVLQVGEPQEKSFREVKQQPATTSRPSAIQQNKPTLRPQEIPIKNNLQAAIRGSKDSIKSIQNNPVKNEVMALDANDDIYIDNGDNIVDDGPISESIGPTGLTDRDKKPTLVTSPNGRQFELPTKIVDDLGETTISIDPNAEARFNARLKNLSVSDSYASYDRVKSCGFCRGKGVINSKACEKCKGDGSIYL